MNLSRLSGLPPAACCFLLGAAAGSFLGAAGYVPAVADLASAGLSWPFGRPCLRFQLKTPV